MKNENMEFFGLRLEPKAIESLSKIAKQRHLPLRTMIRAWIMERLDKETDID